MLPERVRSLIRQANTPGFFGAPISTNVEVTEVLINEAITYANNLKISKKNTIGLIINDLIWLFNGKELVIKQDIKGFNLLFNGLAKNIKIIVKGNVQGDYITGGYLRSDIIIQGSVKGNYTGYRLYGPGSVTVEGDLIGDYTGSMMNEGKIIVKGTITGNDAGEDMGGGSITAVNIVGEYVGKEMMGGEINVSGLIKGDYVGEDLNGGSIIAGEIQGSHVGTEMSDGMIKVNGNLTGDETGHEMYGGSIIVKGQIIGKDTGVGMTKGRIRAGNISMKV